jgi:UDP-N-acetylmuramoyl-L-alanyl-D-glutamate--2,6-diaminopimelate ligase
MIIKNMIKNIEILEVINEQPEIQVKKIAYNSREVEIGSIFVAIAGYVTDGHCYIKNAVNQGARIIVFQNDLKDYDSRVMYIRVADTRFVLGLIAAAFYGNPSKELLITGITGTNGKTSISYMLKHIFEVNQKKCGLIGTIHNLIGERVLDNRGRTTPESLEVQEIIKEMKDAGCDYLSMEVSSHGLALDRVNGVSFDYGIFTNLTQDHLDYHKTFENYFDAKAKLFFQVKKANIINGDDPWGKVLCQILEEKTDSGVITYGFGKTNDYIAKDMTYDSKGTTYTLITPYGEEKIYLNIPGEFMVYNSMAAIVNAIEEKVPLAEIKKAMADMPGIEGRMECLETKAPFDVVIDYAHSPDGLEKLLQSVRKIFKGKIILVFGCNGDRDREKRPIMGKIAGTYADKIVVTSDNPASENPMDIIHAVTSGVKEKTIHYHEVERRDEGVYFGASLCEPGDVLVLAGKGHEKQEIMKEETLYYNEWDTVREAIKRLEK